MRLLTSLLVTLLLAASVLAEPLKPADKALLDRFGKEFTALSGAFQAYASRGNQTKLGSKGQEVFQLYDDLLTEVRNKYTDEAITFRGWSPDWSDPIVARMHEVKDSAKDPLFRRAIDGSSRRTVALLRDGEKKVATPFFRRLCKEYARRIQKAADRPESSF